MLLTRAALHDTPVMLAEIRNAYLQALNSEKHFIISGPECEHDNVGKEATITCDLYYGKCTGRDF